MRCKHFVGTILDAAAGLEPRSIELETHLRTCHDCSVKFRDLRRTMALLDEWKSPEPSLRFDSKLRSRLAEAEISIEASWWSPFLRPALTIGLATFLLVGILEVKYTTRPPSAPSQRAEAETLPGSAVGDLQMLEEVDVFGDSELLDQLTPDQQQAASQN